MQSRVKGYNLSGNQRVYPKTVGAICAYCGSKAWYGGPGMETPAYAPRGAPFGPLTASP